MQWINDNLTSLMVLVGAVSVLLITYSWGDGVPVSTVIMRIPSAIRLVVGGLLLVGVGNLIMWTPGILTGLAGVHFVGEWGLVFAWPGLILGFWLLKLVHKPMLTAYRFISGNNE